MPLNHSPIENSSFQSESGLDAQSRPLKAIFFDIDDTLYSTTNFAAQARRNAAEAMVRAGLNVDSDALLRELNEVIVEFSSNFGRHYDQVIKRFPERARAGTNRAILIAAGVIAYHKTKDDLLRPFPEVKQVLRGLGERGLLLGVITSGREIKQAEKLLRLGLVDLFDPRSIVISEQIGIDKPNPKLYLRACEEAGVAPDAALYVGDHPVKDVGPPASLGMRTVLLRRGGRHSAAESPVRPDWEIGHLGELLVIVDGILDGK